MTNYQESSPASTWNAMPESERVLSLIYCEVAGRKENYNINVLKNTFKTCNEVLQMPKPGIKVFVTLKHPFNNDCRLVIF
jgi:hypothetical protein